MIELRPYQQLAISAALESRTQRQLIVLSTGLGKTITGLGLAKQRGSRMLWLAHTEELVAQPERAAGLVWPEATRGIVKAERNEYMRHLVFASIQTAQREERADRLVEQGFGFVVVDEAHHALSAGYRYLLERLGCFREGGPKLLGLTATPERGDNGALSDVFEGVVFQMGITTAIEQGYLVSPTVAVRKINVDLDSVSVSRGDYGLRELSVALLNAGIVSEVVAGYEEHCQDKKAIVFAISVEQSHAIAAALNARGYRFGVVSGETPKDDRRSILKKLHTGEFQGVVNCMVLTEGFDEPSVNAIILARPTKSKPLMIQMVGRGLRLFPGKTDCLVLDMVGVSKANSLVQAAVIFGHREESERVAGIVQDIDPTANPEEYWIARLKKQVTGVGGPPRSKLNWVSGGDGSWLLAVAEFGIIKMAPAKTLEDLWTLEIVGQKDGPSVTRLTDQASDQETTQAIAEDYVRRAGRTIVAASGNWRGTMASEAQLAFLKRAGINAGGITKGTASDLMTQVIAQKNTELATSKQLYLLRRNGVSVSRDLTKRDASRLIAKLRQGQ